MCDGHAGMVPPPAMALCARSPARFQASELSRDRTIPVSSPHASPRTPTSALNPGPRTLYSHDEPSQDAAMPIQTTLRLSGLAASLLLAAAATYGDDLTPESFWRPGAFAAHRPYEEALTALVQPTSLRTFHDLFASDPHVAGEPGDHQLIEAMIERFETMGLEVERHDLHVLLARPIRAELEIVRPEPETLELTERILDEDPHTAHPDLPFGFNAYSGSGEVTAEIVYANYGRREDFDTLRSLGIDVRGRIVLTRFGGNYRGFKVKFAEEAGAAGVIIYTDPADTGFMRGMPYPEGGWANDTSIQRGSILTKPYPGDPLTPFIEATETAPRLEHEDVELPTIPVQPIGWDAAHRIMRHMTGAGLPPELVRGWQGALPLAYRIEGGTDLRVRLLVEQERTITKTANVIASLKGASEPEKMIILGCHHDAWGFGAGDPLAGLICLFETARCFAKLAEQGHRPARTIVFAAWGAEEFGIIGSTEWVEGRRDMLTEHAVAYINLDMAAMGPDFRASASPALGRAVRDAARVVPSVGDPLRSIHDDWSQDGGRVPPIGDLGGGSDHLPFVCHAAISSVSLGAGGSPGVSYHSNYDTLAWYRKVVGDDYEPARMVSQMALVLAARLAAADLLPFDQREVFARTRTEMDRLQARAEQQELNFDRAAVDDALQRAERTAHDVLLRMTAATQNGTASAEDLARANRTLLGLERRWLDPSGLHHRSWYRNLFAATDPHSGYGSWILPALHEALLDADGPRLKLMMGRYERVLQLMEEDLLVLAQHLPPAAVAGDRSGDHSKDGSTVASEESDRPQPN